MAEMKLDDIRAMSEDQMSDAIVNLKKERFNLRFVCRVSSAVAYSNACSLELFLCLLEGILFAAGDEHLCACFCKASKRSFG